MSKLRAVGCSCFAMAVVLPIVLIVVGEVVLPQVIVARLNDGIVKDTQSKIDEWTSEQAIAGDAEYVFFNLTNAFELQNVNPAPKPHFERISMMASYEGSYFGGESTADGNQFKYSKWTRYVPYDLSDLDKEIVQVNPVYLASIYAFGAPSEKLLFGALGHTILGIVHNALTRFGDGPSNATVKYAEERLGLDSGTLATPASLGEAQFGTNIFTNGTGSVANFPAMQAAGVCAPIELYTHMNDIDAGPFMPGGQLSSLLRLQGFEFSAFKMSFDQASAFLTLFTRTAEEIGQPNYIVVLGSLVQAYLTALNSGDTDAVAEKAKQIVFSPTFKQTFGTLKVKKITGSGPELEILPPMDAAPIIAAAYASYLTVYLPETFFVGCTLVGGQPLRSDGTGSRNGGLFTRRTIREVLNGWEDPLVAVANTLTLPPSISLPAAYEGLLGPYRHEESTVAMLEDAIAAGTVDAAGYSHEVFSGKDDVANNFKFVSFHDSTFLNETNADYFGWGNDGTPGATLEYNGMHNQMAQSPRKDPLSSWAMYMGGFEAKPDFGAGVSFFFEPGRRPVTIGCKSDGTWGDNLTDACVFHDVKGIKTLRYTISPDLLTAKFNGKKSTTCTGTASAQHVDTTTAAGLRTTKSKSTCDFIQRGNGLINREKIRTRGAVSSSAMSQGYLHQVDKAVRDAVTITDPVGATNSDNSGDEIHFVAGEDDISIFIDPITGLVLKGNANTQLNFMIEATMLNSNRYANLFSASTDNGNSFVWPYVYLKRTQILEDDDADNYKRRIYGSFTLGFALIITGIVLCVLCTLLGIVSCVISKKTRGARSPDTESKAGDGGVVMTPV